VIAAALACLLSVPAHAGVARAPGALGAMPLSAPSYGAPAAPMPVLPSYLSVANPVDAGLIAGMLREAQASPTAVAVLAEVAKAVELRGGRPVVIEVADIKEGGTWNIDWNVLSLDRRDIAELPRANVATLIHELQHMLQGKHDVPSDLLETELEAYMVDFRVTRELGEKPKSEYDKKAHRAFKRGLEPFMAYLRKEYPETAQLHKTRSRDYEARLRAGLEEETALRRKLVDERIERTRVLDQMRELGHPEPELRSYHEDVVAPIDSLISIADRAIEWARKDLEIFANPETLAKARKYARAVVRRARRYQKIFARD